MYLSRVLSQYADHPRAQLLDVIEFRQLCLLGLKIILESRNIQCFVDLLPDLLAI